MVFPDEDLSSILMKNDKKGDPFDVLKGKLFPPLGLLYLARVLEEQKITVSVIDLLALNYSVEDAVQRIVDENPQIVGFSVQSANLHKTYRIIKSVRDRINAKIVLGGPHIRYSPEAVCYLDADYGIIGDGEYSFRDLTNALLNNYPAGLNNIDGLVIRNGEGITKNGRALIDDLDGIPFPARHLWRHKCFSPLLASDVATLLTSRGCVYDCIFCGLPDKKISRCRGVTNVIEEFKYLFNAGFRHIELQDDFFTFDRERTFLICEGLLKNNLKIKWTCVTRADFVDSSLLKLMKRSGCTHIKYGIECASERLRNVVIGKRITNEKIFKGVELAKKEGIFTVGYFVIGIPTESLRDIDDTIKFGHKIGLDYLDFHLTLVISGSRLYERALTEGRFSPELWKEVAQGRPVPVYISDGLDISRMQKMISRGLAGFYFSPAFLLKELFFRTRNFENLTNKVRLVNDMALSIILR